MKNLIFQKRSTAGLFVVTVLLLAGCGGGAAENAASDEAAATEQSAAPAVSEEVTREVVQRHLQTFGAGDIEGVLADYADDAVMFTPEGPIRGKEELRTAFEGFIAEFGQEGTTFELTTEEYVGEHGYINWTAETPGNIYHYGVDGFTVRDGKIVVQFFGAHVEPKQ